MIYGLLVPLCTYAEKRSGVYLEYPKKAQARLHQYAKLTLLYKLRITGRGNSDAFFRNCILPGISNLRNRPLDNFWGEPLGANAGT